MPDELWATLIAEALDRAACNLEASSTCRVSYRSTPWYASYMHLDDGGHNCGVCNPAVLPSKVVSLQTMQSTTREILVAKLALWLTHLHSALTPSAATVFTLVEQKAEG